MNRRRVVEVQSGDPESYDEAVERRNALIKETQDIQEQLGRAPPKSGLIEQGSVTLLPDASIKPVQYAAWRRSAISALNRKQADLRRIKEWLRKNDTAKQSEWALLGKAYRLLDAIQASGAMDAGVDGLVARSGALLDEIEKNIPGKYLEQ